MTREPGDVPPENSVFELCPLEKSTGTYKILQYSLLYRCMLVQESDASLMFAAIQSAFERLVELYPILRGYQVQLPDRNVIDTRDTTKPGPLFEICDAQQLTVGGFEQIKYRRSLWPTAVDQILRSRSADTARLLAGTVIRFTDGYLLACSVSHIVADGGGVYILMRQWASLAKQLLAATDGGLQKPMPELPVDYDHTAFWAKLESHPRDEHTFVKFVNQQDFGDTSALQARVAKFYASGSLVSHEPMNMRVLRVSAAAIGAISKEYNEPSGDQNTLGVGASDGSVVAKLHGVQILYALLWQRYVATVVRMRAESETAYTLPVVLPIMHGLRQITPAPAYIGNAVSSVLVTCDLQDILSKPVIELTRPIKQYLRQATPGAALHYINEAFNGADNSFFIKNIYLCTRPESRLVISNASRLAFYDIDFGQGLPVALLCGTLPTEGMAFWLPGADGGVDIHLGLKEDIYTELKRDRDLSKFVEFCT
ncbi:hypothetical protein GGI04_001639 [Coemansia thaxteri]|nr:hypothetical protein GGI04_001639 [Coemansia thaxteri]KAJ2472514.1 hypothetical protein GGI02_001530 [Coemansia sp. RSA 2322]